MLPQCLGRIREEKQAVVHDGSCNASPFPLNAPSLLDSDNCARGPQRQSTLTNQHLGHTANGSREQILGSLKRAALGGLDLLSDGSHRTPRYP